MATDNRDLNGIWDSFFKKRFVAVSAQGGRDSQQVWVTIDGKKVQARCFGDVPSGECLAIELDSGEWLLVTAQIRSVEQFSSRNIELKRTNRKKKKSKGNFKILFRVEDTFYIGGDRPDPISIYEIPSDARDVEGYITNSGYGLDDWEVSIKYLDTEDFYIICNLSPTQNFLYKSSFTDKHPGDSNLLKKNTSITYRGGLTWVSREETPNLTTSFVYSPTFPVCSFTTSVPREIEGRQIGLLTGTSQEVLEWSGSPTGFLGLCSVESVNNIYSCLYSSKNWFISRWEYGENIGTYSETINQTVLYSPVNIGSVDIRNSDIISENRTFLPNGDSGISSLRRLKRDYPDRFYFSVPSTISNFEVESTSLVYRSNSFYIKESSTFRGQSLNGFSLGSRSDFLYSIFPREFNSVYSLVFPDSQIDLDQSLSFIDTILISAEDLEVGVSFNVNIQEIPDYSDFIGKKILIATYISEEQTLVATGIITRHIPPTPTEANKLEILINSKRYQPFSGLNLTLKNTSVITLDEGSVYTFFSWGSSPTAPVLYRDDLNSSISFSGSPYTNHLSNYEQIIVGNNTNDFLLFNSFIPIKNLLRKLNSVKRYFYFSQIKNSVKTQNDTLYAEKWIIKNNGKIVRSPTLEKGKVYSLKNDLANIISVSYYLN